MANSPMSCLIPLSKPELRLFCWPLRCLGRLRAWLRRGRHQLGQPDQVVGRSREREHPTNAGKAAMMGLAKASDRLGPAKHLLDALAHPPADCIARVAGRPTVDSGAPVGGVLRHMRRHVTSPQIGDEPGDIVGLVGTERNSVVAWTVCHHFQCRVAFGRPGGQGQTRLDHQSLSVLH